MYLGVDIGGTFTDLVMVDSAGRISTSKALTTPGELETGVLNAIALAAEANGLAPDELLGRVAVFGHGTTQATNALIERTGARTGLITTRGFGDTIGLQRLLGFTAGLSVDQLGWYSKRRYPDPIVPRELRREVPERVDHAGRILLPLDEDSVRRAVEELSPPGSRPSPWLCSGPSATRPMSSASARSSARWRPDAYVSLSCEVSPVIGEYERTATTALNSYLAPRS